MSGQTLVLTIKAEDVTVKIGSKIIYQVALFSANKTLLSYRIFVECFAVCSSFRTTLISLQNLIFQKTRFAFSCLPFLDMSTEN